MTSSRVSYASGTSSTPLLGQTISANLRATVARVPDRAAVVDVPTGRRLTYAEVDAEVDLLARALLAAGLRKGDVVTDVNGKPITDGIGLIVAIRSHQPGETLTLTVRRDGQSKQVKVTLDSKEG